MDALVGQWWAHSLGLGYLLPADHIKSNLQYAAQRNFLKSFDPGEIYSSQMFKIFGLKVHILSTRVHNKQIEYGIY